MGLEWEVKIQESLKVDTTFKEPRNVSCCLIGTVSKLVGVVWKDNMKLLGEMYILGLQIYLLKGGKVH